MTVPKRRLSKMKGRQRRSHYKAQSPTVVLCSRCSKPVQPHTVCPNCGQYRRRVFLKLDLAKENLKPNPES
ncbi:MAG: 50S ribosomal protein L32 [Deltaproteobacteria bacterium]|nr:50S ribosomal protein L32 [Deltaproteobacteria bacterium]